MEKVVGKDDQKVKKRLSDELINKYKQTLKDNSGQKSKKNVNEMIKQQIAEKLKD